MSPSFSIGFAIKDMENLIARINYHTEVATADQKANNEELFRLLYESKHQFDYTISLIDHIPVI